MGWEDRDYYRQRSSGWGFGNVQLLNAAVPLGSWFGIRVRVHVALLIYMVVELLTAEGRHGIGVKNALTSMIILFFSVLLHEFGHCFGARWVGGRADDILMWPLGGLAMTQPPHRPWPSFISTAAGPAVNLLICIITGVIVHFESRAGGGIPWFPFGTEGISPYIPYHSTLGYYCFWIFTVNYGLLAFNLLLLYYPFDGGRMVQELLWLKMGYNRSMLLATRIGMIGAIVTALVGIAFLNATLVLVAVFGFITCYRQYQGLSSQGPEESWQTEPAYSASYTDEDRVKKAKPKEPGYFARRRAEKEARTEAEEQATVDQILAKVSASGMNSLTDAERTALKQATENQRKRDEARAAAKKKSLGL